MNEYDSGRVLRMMELHGYEKTRDAAAADLIFLNTCSIREKAEQKVHSYLGRLRPMKKKNPDMVIAVGGCVAQQFGERFLQRTPYLDIVLGTHALGQLPRLVAEVLRTRKQQCCVALDYDLSLPPMARVKPGHVSAFLTIMQGCNNFCSYCIVPYVRGREISRPVEDIVQEAESLIASGVKEITLLGQNVNSYGRGLEPAADFPMLIEKIARLKGLERLRFTTSHPKDLSLRLIKTIADTAVVCEHIHLPVQAGATSVLESMRRGYTREEYLAKVDALREACPEIAITTDVIVGFPGETEDDFQQTIDLVEKVGFDGMYSFKYSDREGTRASKMDSKVDEEVKGRRLAALQSLQKEITLRLNRKLVGHTLEVLVDGFGREPGQLSGRTRSNRIVNFSGPEGLEGELVMVAIKKAWANSLLGETSSVCGGVS